MFTIAWLTFGAVSFLAVLIVTAIRMEDDL